MCGQLLLTACSRRRLKMQSLRGLSSDGTSTTAFEMLFSDFEETHCGFMMVEVKESGWEQRQTRHACALHLFKVRGAGRQTANMRLVRRVPVDRLEATGACTTTSNPHNRNIKTLCKAFSPLFECGGDDGAMPLLNRPLPLVLVPAHCTKRLSKKQSPRTLL